MDDEDEVRDRLIFAYEYGGDARPGPYPTVTLTAGAAADRFMAGLNPLSVDDYVDRHALLLSHQREYLRWQLDWLRRLGARAGVPPEACRAAFGYLRSPVDSVVAWSSLLRDTIRRAGPTEVIYIGPAVDDEREPWHGSHMQFWPKLGDRPLADRLLPLVCAQVGVGFRAEYWQAPASVVCSTDVAPSVRTRIRENLVVPYNFWPAGSWRRRGPSSVMLWPSGYGARIVARAEKRRHRRVLLLDRRKRTPALIQVLPAGSLRLSRALDIQLPATTTPLSEDMLELLDELDHWTGVSRAGRILEHRLATYLNRVCPTVERLSRQLEPALRREDVVAVIATNPYTFLEYGCLLAASRIPGVQRTLVQHGDHAYSYDSWLATETQNFDRFAFSDPTVPGDLTEAAQDLGCPVPTFDKWAPRLDHLLRHRARAAPRHEGPICYLPTVFNGEAADLGESGFDDTWYFRWQRALLGIMAEHSQLSFMWKALPPSSQKTGDPLPIFIERVPNVRYETMPFTVLAVGIAATITDFSSTGLYEAVALGLPVLALSFNRFEVIRPRARTALGPVLHPCQDISDGEAAVREFLARLVRNHTIGASAYPKTRRFRRARGV
jgi:hypothetical protein